MHAIVSEDNRAESGFCVQGVDVLVCSWTCGEGADNALSACTYEKIQGRLHHQESAKREL